MFHKSPNTYFTKINTTGLWLWSIGSNVINSAIFDREKRSFRGVRGARRGSFWTWDTKSIITISLCSNDHYEIMLQNTDVLYNNDFNLATLQLARNVWNFAGVL